MWCDVIKCGIRRKNLRNCRYFHLTNATTWIKMPLFKNSKNTQPPEHYYLDCHIHVLFCG